MSLPASIGNNGPSGTSDRFAPMRIAASAAALAGLSAAATMAFGGGAAIAVVASLAGVAMGYVLGRKERSTPDDVRLLLFRVADDLAQYRAFTRLLRDQGARITEATGGAATVIIAGLTDMDTKLDRLRALVDHAASGDGKELRALVDEIGAPLVDMLGQLQFQDVTQQQIAFLSRLSLIVDQHMIGLARQLGDRRSMDRDTNFKEMFDKALDDCVMDCQRQDHRAAAGLDRQEAGGPKIELF